MKILILSTSLEGGAGHSAYRLHRGLKNLGEDSTMLVQAKSVDDSEVLIAPRTPGMKIIDALGRITRADSIDHLILRFYRHREHKTFSLQWTPDAVFQIVTQLRPDIIHLGWVCGGLMRIETLRKLQQPIVWTLSDMWPFTGGCHHSEDCDGYRDRCGGCPRLGSRYQTDLSRWIWRRKSKAHANKRLTVVAPSSWMAERARQSALFKKTRVEIIPHGLDTRCFQPVDRRLARKMLGLPMDKPLLLFGAWNPVPAWKGADLLQAALEKLPQSMAMKQAELVVFGGASQNGRLAFALQNRFLGRFHDDISLAVLYSAVDVLIMPSRYESFGQTATEALACGTPVVGFKADSMPDIVDHQKNGYLAIPFDADDLARGIRWVLEDEQRYASLSQRAREKAEREYGLERYARRYKALFEDILQSTALV